MAFKPTVYSENSCKIGEKRNKKERRKTMEYTNTKMIVDEKKKNSIKRGLKESIFYRKKEYIMNIFKDIYVFFKTNFEKSDKYLKKIDKFKKKNEKLFKKCYVSVNEIKH